MSDYKILYVDEVGEERRKFQLYIKRNDSENKFKVDAKEPEPNIDDFVEMINNENYDAIISDHKLSEENPNIPYDGLDLVSKILETKFEFPCFILTSFDDEAVKDGEDVNIVYIKGLMNGEDGHRATFIDKIENQIKHHKNKIKKYEIEYAELLSNAEINSQDDDRLSELDTLLEKMVNKDSSIPKNIKTRSNLDELHKMINNTDELIAQLKGS